MQNHNYYSCCVFGHRDIKITKELENKLKYIFIDLIENKQVGIFYFGGFGDFDELCNKLVKTLQKTYTHIKRVYVCDDYKYIERPRKRPLWLNADDYDDLVYFDIVYTGFYKRIYFRNLEIIDHSDYCVFYIIHSNNSGAYKVLQYAIRRKKEIIDVLK